MSLLLLDEWRAEFDRQRTHPPKAGDVLRGPDLGSLKIEIQLFPDKDPFLVARAFSPQVVGYDPAWICRPAGDYGRNGLLCILLPSSRKEAIRRFGLGSLSIEVQSVIVTRESASANSLLIEVHTW